MLWTLNYNFEWWWDFFFLFPVSRDLKIAFLNYNLWNLSLSRINSSEIVSKTTMLAFLFLKKMLILYLLGRKSVVFLINVQL